MATATSGKLGKKFKDVPAAKPNSHGVVTSGFETIEVPLPKTSKCEAKIRLARLTDGWRYGLELRRSQGGQSFGPSERDTAHASRQTALEIAAVRVRDWFVEAEERSEPAEAERCRKAMSAAQDFIDGLPNAEPKVGKNLGLLSTTTPAGIVLHDPSVDLARARKPTARELPKPIAAGQMLDLSTLTRHEETRQPLSSDIQARAESLREDGQLEDVVVRQMPGDWYQIISGETRCEAARSLGWTQIRCTIIDCDDDEALRLLGLYNGQRANLNPIQKAKHIKAMCDRGATREEAARAVGLESGAAATNFVRLLQLPKVWIDRVASEELAPTWARFMIPVAHIPAVMDELDRRFKRNGESAWERTFDKRDNLEEDIEQLIHQHTRRLDSTKREYRGQYADKIGGHDAMGEYPCLLHADEIEANRAKLKIVQVTIDGKEVEVATNVELFDELQCALIKKRHEEKGKKKAAKAGAATDAGEAAKQSAQDRQAQLARSIEVWRENFLRSELKRAILEFKPTKQIDVRLLKLIMFYLCDGMASTTPDLADRLEQIVGRSKSGGMVDAMTTLNSVFADVATGDAHFAWQKIAAQVCAFLVGGDADDPWEVELWPETLQALFEEWGCDLTTAWKRLHAIKDPRLEEFYELHRKAELIDLAMEIAELELAENVGKPQMIRMLLARTTPPAVPAALLPPKKESKAKTKRGGK
jgi:ParB/RepB/Spo0J family partition protein